MSPIINTNSKHKSQPFGLAFCFCTANREARAQVAGQRSCDHDSRAQVRSAAVADRRSPRHRTAELRSSNRDPWISVADAPSNKYTSPVEGSCAKKKLTPLHRECERCQAIWDFAIETRPFLIIFNSAQIGTPSIQIYRSGIPSPALFSILWKCVRFGICCFNKFDRLFSVFGIGHPLHIIKRCRVILAKISKSGCDIFSA